MTLGNPRPFDPEHLRRWWEVTRNYLMAEPASEPRAADLSGGTPRWVTRGQDSQPDTRSPVRDATAVDGARPHLTDDGLGGHCLCRLPGRIASPIAANAGRAILTRKSS